MEFAEEFNPEEQVELYGAYLLIPPMPASYTKEVEIRVYEGVLHSDHLIAKQNLKPQFLNYSSSAGTFLTDKNMNKVATETFVLFDEPVKINSKFFIAYRIDNAPDASFVVYNTKFLPGKFNTTWINQNGTWVCSSAYSTQPVTTSLAIQALSSYTHFDYPTSNPRTNIQYIRSENRLYLPETNLENGQVFVYAVSGQLLQQIPVNKGNSYTDKLRSFPDGTIGIVRVIRGNEIYTGKFIY